MTSAISLAYHLNINAIVNGSPQALALFSATSRAAAAAAVAAAEPAREVRVVSFLKHLIRRQQWRIQLWADRAAAPPPID